MAPNLRKRIIEKAYQDKMGHIPSAISILDILWVLHDKVMTKDDQFILSKGHGCLALYAVLEAKGQLDWSKPLQGHPKREGAILASTGSLGHGLPMAVGLALAKKIKGEKGRVFCLIGDGECNEGTIWESALIANHHKLNNLMIFVDQNKSSERALSMGHIDQKFDAFGFTSFIINGHVHKEIEDVTRIVDNGPIVIIANTIKGKGFKEMENNPAWHHRFLTKEEYEKIFS